MKNKENQIERLKVMESSTKITKRLFDSVDEFSDTHWNILRNYIDLMKITLEEFENGTKQR